jgi:hypothetical protein
VACLCFCAAYAPTCHRPSSIRLGSRSCISGHGLKKFERGRSVSLELPCSASLSLSRGVRCGSGGTDARRALAQDDRLIRAGGPRGLGGGPPGPNGRPEAGGEAPSGWPSSLFGLPFRILLRTAASAVTWSAACGAVRSRWLVGPGWLGPFGWFPPPQPPQLQPPQHPQRIDGGVQAPLGPACDGKGRWEGFNSLKSSLLKSSPPSPLAPSWLRGPRGSRPPNPWPPAHTVPQGPVSEQTKATWCPWLSTPPRPPARVRSAEVSVRTRFVRPPYEPRFEFSVAGRYWVGLGEHWDMCSRAVNSRSHAPSYGAVTIDPPLHTY